MSNEQIRCENEGWAAAIAWLEAQHEAYVAKYGIYDPATGVTEFPDGGEYDGTLLNMIDGMTAAAAQATGSGRGPLSNWANDLASKLASLAFMHQRNEALAHRIKMLQFESWDLANILFVLGDKARSTAFIRAATHARPDLGHFSAHAMKFAEISTPVKRAADIGNKLHNLASEHQNNEALAYRLVGLRSHAWDLALLLISRGFQ